MHHRNLLSAIVLILLALVPRGLAAASAASETLTWSLANANYEDGWVNGFGNAWMYHALRWKALRTGAEYHPEEANLPGDRVFDYYADWLNDREDDTGYYACVFPQPGDPSGGWVAGEGIYRDYHAFVWFAVVTECYDSPLYANIRQGFHFPVVIREMTATVAYGGCTTIHCMCSDLWDCSSHPSTWIHQCEARAEGYVDATSMKYDVWTSQYTKNQTLTGQDLWQAWSDRQLQYRDVVFDPPAEIFDAWVAEGLIEAPSSQTKAVSQGCQSAE